MAKPSSKSNNVVCEICGKPCYVTPSRLKTQKHFTCSMECNKKIKSITMSGKGNHQYGLRGELNSSYKGNKTKIKNGYEFIRLPNHQFADEDGFVRKHRLVVERELLTEENSIIINEEMYLKPELEVHHIDENKLNNNPDNLMILTKSQHIRLHNLGNICFMIRDKITGRFVKSTKKDLELL